MYLNKTSLYARVLLHCLLPLIPGLFIYVFLRSGTYINALIRYNHPSLFMQDHRVMASIIKYNVPDFLWAYSFSSALFIWGLLLDLHKKILGLIIFLIVISTEIIQLAFPSSFTFDFWDLGAAVLAFLISFILLQLFNENAQD